MRLRRRRGATLGLVATVAVIIAIIGVCFFFLTQILGGGRELSNAVDAGALNAAKNALLLPKINTVAAGAPQFIGLGENNSDDINLLTYNRAVAETVFVLMNSQEQGNQQSSANAQLVVQQLEKLGTQLADGLNGSATNNAFEFLARVNSVKQLGRNSSVTGAGDIESAFLRPGGSTNVFFNPQSIAPAVDMTPYFNTDAQAMKAPGGQPYLRGYIPISMGGATVFGVPVFPTTHAHLVTQTEFNNQRTIQGASQAQQDTIPPNTFRGKGQARAERANSMVGAVASAVVGCLDRQFEARFPLGYIRFFNREGMDVGTITCASDGSNDLFNKELFAPSQILFANNEVFTTNEAEMAAWIAFNTGSGPDPGDCNMRKGCGPGQRATRQDCEGVTSVVATCTHTMYDGTLAGPCIDQLDCWATNYGRKLKNVDFDGRGLTTVEYMKAQVLAERAKGGRNQRCGVGPPPEPTGMKLFDKGVVYAAPPNPVKFGQIGTPWQLMSMVGTCATQSSGYSFGGLFRRANQIKPGVTASELIAILNSRPLPLGATLYLYADSAGRLVLDDVGPRSKSNAQPDGTRNSTLCENKYDVNGLTVNSVGDGMFTSDSPYSSCEFYKPPARPEYKGIDRAVWTPSTGYQQLLGVMEFENYATDGAEFCMPN